MYCALSDIIDQVPEQKVIELTDDENTGEVNQARVDKAIATAGTRARRGGYPILEVSLSTQEYAFAKEVTDEDIAGVVARWTGEKQE